jgi:anti-sigma factor RsiW
MKNETEKRAGCGRSDDLVTYLYGEATPVEAADFEKHLTACVECRDELTAFQSVRGNLQHWELEAVPPRIDVAIKPTFWQSLKDLFNVTPLWGRLALGGVGTLALLALFNVSVTVGNGGVTFSAGWRQQPAQVAVATPAPVQPTPVQVKGTDEAAVRAIVSQLIKESERRQAEQVEAKMVALTSKMTTQQRAEFVKAVSQLKQEQRVHLATLIQENSRRGAPDLLDLIGQVPSANAEVEE